MHFLTGLEFDAEQINQTLDIAQDLKQQRDNHGPLLKGKHLALVFEKPSLRTRFSFTIAMRELGGSVVESNSLNSKFEEPQDVAQVLAGYCHGIMVRTHEDSNLAKMASVSKVPVINGLSEDHHPCQTLADLLTLKEKFGSLNGLKVAYIGDGNNILHSLMLLAPQVGVSINYACPDGYQPNCEILAKASSLAVEHGARIQKFADPELAVKGVNAVYTDVWTSMGFEGEEKQRDEDFDGFQLNEELMKIADSEAIAMHCLPMVRGKEISDSLADSPCSAIFDQAENRLHAQKALLVQLMNG